MEPQVTSSLLAFLQAGGEPEKVIDLLSSNYSSTAQLANLLGTWLADLELEGRHDDRRPLSSHNDIIHAVE